MSESSRKRAEEFLKVSGQFKLGALTTESSHPVTAHLSDVAKNDIAEALDLLFAVDGDVVAKYREFAESGRAGEIRHALLRAIRNGGRIFFTGCGATGRLSIQLASIWRDFWQRQRVRFGGQDFEETNGPLTSSLSPSEGKGVAEGRVRGAFPSAVAADFEARALSVMAGGDFALIKSVEGFEDYTEFGRKQIGDLGVSAKDVVFAITEGGETSFVIGTAWKGVEVGAKVYFIYNNPDDVLCQHVQRSREVLAEPRIEKINLTTGPMAIAGSTRMQATTIHLCVLLTVLEMALRDLMIELEPGGPCALDSANVPSQFLLKLEELHATLGSPRLLAQLARLVTLEELVYRAGRKNNYYADRLGIDVLTDTTERSPTYCTPAFRKFDETQAAESWSFLFVPEEGASLAWKRILKRKPDCVAWSERDVQALVGGEKFRRTYETIQSISFQELMRFKVGLDGLKHRPLGAGDSAVGIICGSEEASLLAADGFCRRQLEEARKAGAQTGVLFFGRQESFPAVARFIANWNPDCVPVLVPVPPVDLLLDGVMRVGVKMLLNALSTCTMVRLGRVMGNYMVWVVPSNLKLIDRATRYIGKLTGLSYEQANLLLFEVIEFVEPRMKVAQAYPPVVGVAVMRARHGVGNEEAEKRLMAETACANLPITGKM